MSVGAHSSGGGAMTIADTATTEGERRKLDSHAMLEARREVHVLRGRRALLQQLLNTGQATADDVRDAVELPSEVRPVCLGAVPGPLARAGIIRRVGFVKTGRPDAHARPISLWELGDRDAAVRSLAAHPDRVDPSPSEMDTDPSLLDFGKDATPGAGTPGGH